MTTRKIPMRKCTGCGVMADKKSLIRVILTPEDEVVLDRTGKKNGRGAYICNNIECLKKAVRSKGLEKSLKHAVPEDVYERLSKEFDEVEE